MKEASFYGKGRVLRCLLCPHYCQLEEGEQGRCRVRENQGGVLYERTYPLISALALDPIEKKPLYHFYPGSSILSLGMAGCNLSCSFCQNWELSLGGSREGREILPAQLVEKAHQEGSLGLAFTYSEPLIFYEYVKEAAILGKKKGLKNVLVSNGYINEAPLQELLPFIDAVNLDVKSIQDHFYQKYCGGRLQPVQKTLEILLEEGIHVEVTNLIIPTLNDSQEDLQALFRYLYSLKPEIPLHLTRYFPHYKMKIQKTKEETMIWAYQMAREELPYVYLGNLPLLDYQKTYCPQCNQSLIQRFPYLVIHTQEGRCPNCSYLLPFRHHQ